MKTNRTTNEALATRHLQKMVKHWQGGASFETCLASAKAFMKVGTREQRTQFLQALASGANARAAAAAAEAKAVSARMDRAMAIAPTRGQRLVEHSGSVSTFHVPCGTARA